MKLKLNKNLISIILLSASTFIVGALSYTYHPLMIKYLDSLDLFAEFESLIGIINLLGVITMSAGYFLVKEISKIGKHNKYKIRILTNLVFKKGFSFGIIIFGIYILLSGLIASFLNIDNILVINLAGFTLFLGFIGIYQNVFLQGTREFKIISSINTLNPIFRVGIGFSLVLLGFGIYGAIGGFIISGILLFIIKFFIIRKKLKSDNSINTPSIPRRGLGGGIDLDIKKLEKQIIQDFFKQKTQIFQFFLASIIIALLMNLDILFAKHLFDAETAGTYAGISIIAKFLVFIGMSIETVYYPDLTSEKVINISKIFLTSGLYVILTLGALIFFYLFGEYILDKFKEGFSEYLSLLYLLIIYCGALSLLSFYIKILIAFNKYILNYVLVFLLITLVFLLRLYTYNNIYTFINIFNIIIFISLISGFVYLFFIKKVSKE